MHSSDQIRIYVILGRYAVGVHRRVDIYSIESAGVEYSIDMKVGVLNLVALQPKCCQFQDQLLDASLWAKRLAKNNPWLLIVYDNPLIVLAVGHGYISIIKYEQCLLNVYMRNIDLASCSGKTQLSDIS